MGPVVLVGVAALFLACALWASRFERWWLDISRRDVPLAKLPAGMEGLTIAHVSDVHWGPFVDAGFIERSLERVNALRPDVVLLTGDYIDRRASEIEPVARVLGRLRAPLGVWAVLGGHDVRGSERLSRVAFRENGIRLLLNDAAPLVPGPMPLWVAGVRDNSEYYLHCLESALAPVPPGARTILLAHSPDIACDAAERGVDLVLSGHTHGGQICLPFFGPLITESEYWRRFARGLNRAGSTWVHTSRGLGVVRLRARFFCRPEVTLLRLVRAPAAASAAGEEERRLAAGEE